MTDVTKTDKVSHKCGCVTPTDKIPLTIQGFLVICNRHDASYIHLANDLKEFKKECAKAIRPYFLATKGKEGEELKTAQKICREQRDIQKKIVDESYELSKKELSIPFDVSYRQHPITRIIAQKHPVLD